MFDIVDWTRSSAQVGPPKISAWRLRAIPGHKPKAHTNPSSTIQVEMVRNGSTNVSVLPLHCFLDLKVLEDAVSFGYGVGSTASDILIDETEPGIEDTTPPSTPQFIHSVAEDMEQTERKASYSV
ncbi:hypothetical protein FRC12_012908 [Ceratobasidium sp. 428]|nr:hypothetical protein FRC12_012908 [Ceratobasidium sp. 428]